MLGWALLLRANCRRSSSRVHCKASIWVARPLGLRTVPVQFDAISVGVVEIQRFAHAVIGGACQRNSRV